MRIKKTVIIFSILGLLTSSFTGLIKAEEIVISGNGAESANHATVEVDSISTVTQTNNAQVENNVNATADTGNNSVSSNTGGDVSIDTGNATQNITVENSLNVTSANTQCCNGEETKILISGNGTDSANDANLTSTTNNVVEINQNANITNNITGYLNTGGNTANSNNGNVAINTGNAKVQGKLINGPVNYTQVTTRIGGGESKVNITGNGDGSDNRVNLDLLTNNYVLVNNNAKINNFVAFDVNTGGNTANSNNGRVDITTGDAFFEFYIKNGPINFSKVLIEKCKDKEVTPDEDDEDEEDGEKDEDGEEKPPTEEKKDDGDGGEGGNGGNGVIIAAPGPGQGGPGILGLSDTSSAAAKTLFYWVGMIMMAFGVGIIGGEVAKWQKKAKLKAIKSS